MASPIRGAPIRRRSTVDAAVEAIRDQILEGEVEPGTALREVDLCEVFGVSRATIRSALLNLSHEGLVRLEPHRGAIVPELAAAQNRQNLHPGVVARAGAGPPPRGSAGAAGAGARGDGGDPRPTRG